MDFNLRPIVSAKRKRRTQTEWGFVYFMENRATGLVKIGRTRSLERRVGDVDCAKGTTPGERAYLGWIKVSADRAAKLEAAMHKRFDQYRKDGEWFQIGGLDLLAVASEVSDREVSGDVEIVGLQPPAKESLRPMKFPVRAGSLRRKVLGMIG